MPGHTHQVDAAKYKAMKRALLKVLPPKPPGLSQSEMIKAVVKHLPDDLFPGGSKAGWRVKTVQLDLEAKRVLTREAPTPLRWHRRLRLLAGDERMGGTYTGISIAPGCGLGFHATSHPSLG